MCILVDVWSCIVRGPFDIVLALLYLQDFYWQPSVFQCLCLHMSMYAILDDCNSVVCCVCICCYCYAMAVYSNISTGVCTRSMHTHTHAYTHLAGDNASSTHAAVSQNPSPSTLFTNQTFRAGTVLYHSVRYVWYSRRKGGGEGPLKSVDEGLAIGDFVRGRLIRIVRGAPIQRIRTHG